MDAFIVLVKLLCAHLCADFIFQTDSINKGKRKSGGKGVAYNLLHSLVHAGAAYLFVANVSYWFIPIIVFVSHFVIDWIKCRFCEDNLPAFLVDQFMHIAIICIVWFVFFGKEVDYTFLENIDATKVWLTIMAYIIMLRPSSIFLGLFLKKWTPASTNAQSLPNAGQWIGYNG